MAHTWPGLDQLPWFTPPGVCPAPRLDFALQSELALKRKVSDGLAMTMTFEQVHVAVTQAGTWVSYDGAARIVLAVVLVAAAGGVAYAGIRLPLPVRPARPSEGARTFMLVTWGFAITAFLVCLPIYVQQARRE